MPVIFHDVIKGDGYLHFILLHSACRALSVLNPTVKNLDYAEVALKVFVQCCAELIGPSFISYNIHGLLNVVDDVKNFGNLNSLYLLSSYSAFPYEDNMIFFRKYLRRPSLLLQQLYYRIKERKNEKNSRSNQK